MALRPVTAYEDRLLQLRDRLAQAAGVRRIPRLRQPLFAVPPFTAVAARVIATPVTAAWSASPDQNNCISLQAP